MRATRLFAIGQASAQKPHERRTAAARRSAGAVGSFRCAASAAFWRVRRPSRWERRRPGDGVAARVAVPPHRGRSRRPKRGAPAPPRLQARPISRRVRTRRNRRPVERTSREPSRWWRPRREASLWKAIWETSQHDIRLLALSPLPLLRPAGCSRPPNDGNPRQFWCPARPATTTQQGPGRRVQDMPWRGGRFR